MTLMNRRDKNDPLPSPASKQDVQAFEKGTDSLGPQGHMLRLDISSAVKTPWNIRAAKVFCADLRQRRKMGLYPHLPDVSDSEVEKAFMTHLIHLRRLYQRSGHS